LLVVVAINYLFTSAANSLQLQTVNSVYIYTELNLTQYSLPFYSSVTLDLTKVVFTGDSES